MLSENEARDLLRKAGETIEVDPTRPVHVEAKPRSTWLVLGAAASVAAISLASWAVLAQSDSGTHPSDPSVSAPTNGAPEGTVPSVFGYDRETGTAFLQSLGYQVKIEPKPDCSAPGRAIGTVPSTGTPVEPGSTVTLLVASTSEVLDCAFAPQLDAWAFVDFANGHGPAPAFASSVTLVMDDSAPVTISGAEAAEPANWGTPSALTELHEATQYVVQHSEDGKTQYFIPALGTRHGTPPDEYCGVERPAVVGKRGALTLVVDVVMEGVINCPTTVALYFTGDRIDTVVTYTEKPVAGVIDAIQVPAVTGLSLEDARDVVTAAGLTATEEHEQTCSPPDPGVVEQAPKTGFLLAPGQTVTLVTEVRNPDFDCPGVAPH